MPLLWSSNSSSSRQVSILRSIHHTRIKQRLRGNFNHLEDALVKFKSCDNTAESQANVERYIRKAKMYYSNNPKIKLLLQEVENEIEDANEREEESKRKAWNVVK